jgi:hypothetical protein
LRGVGTDDRARRPPSPFGRALHSSGAATSNSRYGARLSGVRSDSANKKTPRRVGRGALKQCRCYLLRHLSAVRKFMDNEITVEYKQTLDGDKLKGKGAARARGTRASSDPVRAPSAPLNAPRRALVCHRTRRHPPLRRTPATRRRNAPDAIVARQERYVRTRERILPILTH